MTQHLTPLTDFDRWLATDAGRVWRALHPPIVGAQDGENDDGNDEDDENDGDDPPSDPPPADPPKNRRKKTKATPPPPPASSDDEDDEDDDDTDDDDELSKARREAAAAKARAAQVERENKRLKREQEKRDRQRQQEQGEYEELYNQEKRAKEELETKTQMRTLRASVRDWATKLNFRNPQTAVTLVMPNLQANLADLVDEDLEVDEQAVERALKALAKSEPYMVRPTKQQRDELNGNRGSSNKRSNSGGGSPPPTDDKSKWNPPDTLRNAYASADSGG